MEKLITKRNIFIASGLGILLITLAYFFLLNSNKETEKYFDIYLANLYNEGTQGIDQKMEYLSNISDPNVSFFADLNLASIKNLDKYEKLERDIILLKKAIVDFLPLVCNFWAALNAILVARDVLPIEGRPAIIIKSD